VALRFDQPEWLWGLVLVPVLAVLMLRWCGSMSLPRRVVAIAARAGLMAVALGMVAGVSMVRTTDRLAVMAVVDVSGSMRTLAGAGVAAGGRDGVERARSWLAAVAGGNGGRARGPDDLLGLVAFDGQSAVVAAPTAGDPLARALDVTVREGTDIARALRLALAAFPRDAARRVVLISDGVQTSGDALAAAAEARSIGVPIDVVPIRYRVDREVMVDELDAPAAAPAGAVVALRVAITSTGPASGTLRVFEEDRPIDLGTGTADGRRVDVQPGRNFVIVNVPLGPERVHRFRARFDADGAADTIAANNEAEAVVVSGGSGAILVVEGHRGDGGAEGEGVLARTLRGEGFEVESVSPDGVPTDLLRLQAYDLVILENVPADALGQAGQARLAGYVAELGGGLVMVGGPASFGAGGYKGGALEPLLPVKLELPDRLVSPSLAVVFVLDCSGSMGWSVMGSSRTQQDIANEGAAAAVRTLDPGDLVGVITFNEAARTRVPLGKLEDSAKVAGAIMKIAPGGGTNMPPALEEATRALKAADAKLKHIVVLTDGVSRGRERLQGLAAAAAAAGIKVSTIAVGDDPDPDTLARMAEVGGGTYYRVVDPMSLPRVFMRAVRVVRTPMVRETPFVPVAADRASPLLEGVLSAGEMPPLGGLTLTQARTEPTVVNALLSPEGEPVLAHWRAGLGQVAAFTSDAHKWAEPWLPWAGYRALWTRVARQVSRPTGGRAAELVAGFTGDDLTLRLEATGDDGRPLDGLEVPAAVYAPDGSRTEVVLRQDGAGVYQATVRREHGPGTYVVTVSPKGERGPLPPVVGGVTKPRGAEYRTLRSDDVLMEGIARSSGGRVLDLAAPEGAKVFDRTGVPPREARTPLWPVLLPWALVLALADIGVRRVAWDRLLSRRFGEGLMRHAARAVRDRGEQVAGTVAALREREAEFEARQEAQGGARLTARDARKIIEERREQMIAQQRAAQRARAGGASSPPPAPPKADGGGAATGLSSPPYPAAQAEPGAEEGGLLGAKRRARARFEEQQGG